MAHRLDDIARSPKGTTSGRGAIRLIAAGIILIITFVTALQVQAASATPGFVIGPDAVFTPPTSSGSTIVDCFNPGRTPDPNGPLDCVESELRTQGATDSAVLFYELTGEVLVSYQPAGSHAVGFATTPACCSASLGLGELVILGSVPAVIHVGQLADSVPLNSYAGYAGAVRDIPQLTWADGPMQLDHVATSPQGGDRLVVALSLSTTCRLCRNGYEALLAVDFYPDGSQAGSRPLGIICDPLPPQQAGTTRQCSA